jgi:hypothetical protein
MSVTHKPTTVDNDRVIRLSAYLHGLADPDINGMALFHIYQEDLEKVTPHEVMELLNREYQSGMTADQILTFLDKAINAFGQGLRHYPATQPSPLTFLDLIDSERILGQQAEVSLPRFRTSTVGTVKTSRWAAISGCVLMLILTTGQPKASARVSNRGRTAWQTEQVGELKWMRSFGVALICTSISSVG